MSGIFRVQFAIEILVGKKEKEKCLLLPVGVLLLRTLPGAAEMSQVGN